MRIIQARRNAWTMVIGVAIAALVIMFAIGIEAIRAERWAQPRAGDMVQNGVRYRDVQFGSTTYRLPVDKYMIRITPYDTKRDYAAFFFDAIVPEVAPASDEPEEVARWGKGKGWFRQVHGLVEYGRNFITQQRQLDEWFKDSRLFKALVEKRDAEERRNLASALKFLDSNVYTALADGCRKYEGESLAGNVIQVCGSGDDDQMLLVTCKTGNVRLRVPSPGCEVTTNLSDKTRVTYYYSYDYFDEALAIHRKVIALIESFRVDAKP